ncbi:DUF4334 domain-containing protein [Mesorhizobium sp. M0145]|uniref:DUF4334 domain-containing protein n=1 Tax=Mesorhizobium sp. M0145 TaxID=2956895 RepID=UPI00333C070A
MPCARCAHRRSPAAVPREEFSRCRATSYLPTAPLHLRKVEHRGITSAAIIYDGRPIIDYLRRIDDDRPSSAILLLRPAWRYGLSSG